MERETNLPFKVGDLVETRSFQSGFRGAWFRCKIRDITKKQGIDMHLLEYYDFPDDKLKTLRLYQLAPHPSGKGRATHKELMLRPQYPLIYNAKQMHPAPSELSEVTIIVDNSWKVGDLVDWWSDGCYWSGKITQLLSDDKAQIELKPPPLGEGSLYEVFYKDVRPSLDWSPEQGWTIPCQEGESGLPCARIMKPTNQAGTDGVPSNSAISDEAKITRTKEEMIKKRSREEENEEEGQTTGTKEEMIKKRSREEEKDEEGWNSNRKLALIPDTIEEAIMDLEESLNKVKWLKKVLHSGGIPSPEPQWELVDQNPKS